MVRIPRDWVRERDLDPHPNPGGDLYCMYVQVELPRRGVNSTQRSPGIQHTYFLTNSPARIRACNGNISGRQWVVPTQHNTTNITIRRHYWHHCIGT